MKRLSILLIASLAIVSAGCAKVAEPLACGPVPNENQLKVMDMETYAFLHYSLNTYTDEEWGYGNEDPAIFNPSSLDARQWAKTCKAAGMKGIIFTAKHHCGFCMWPSAYTEYSVKNSTWKDGQGDVVRELAEACREEGLKFAVYLSPWDRNHVGYATEEYVEYFRNQLRELLSNYGEMFEVWFDGANGGNGWYGGADETRKIAPGYYGWDKTYALVRNLQPDICVWGDHDAGADLRWCGTEAGFIGDPDWSLLTKSEGCSLDMRQHGVEDGDMWITAESDVSIRPGWFYHKSEDDKVKTVAKLMDIYYKTVGRNGTLLLNFPITPDGLIHPIDSSRAASFKAMVDKVFSVNLAEGAKVTASNVRGKSRKYGAALAFDNNSESYWATDDDVTSASVEINFGKELTFNRFMAQEYVKKGQRVKNFKLEAFVNGAWTDLKDELAESGGGLNTIGYKRIICFPEVTASRFRFTVLDSKACPLISSIGIYHAPEIREGN